MRTSFLFFLRHGPRSCLSSTFSDEAAVVFFFLFPFTSFAFRQIGTLFFFFPQSDRAPLSSFFFCLLRLAASVFFSPFFVLFLFSVEFCSEIAWIIFVVLVLCVERITRFLPSFYIHIVFVTFFLFLFSSMRVRY